MLRDLKALGVLVTAMAAVVLAPGIASAQPALSKDLPFTTVSKSAFGAQSAPVQKVITNKADYSAFFGGNPPASPAVDFASEDVLAVSMGTKNTGGYSIEITRVELMTGGFTGGWAFVDVKETSPAPGTMVPMVITQPAHVVKLKKAAIQYAFRSAATPTPTTGFASVELAFNSPVKGYNKTVKVLESGKVEIYQSSPTAKYAPVLGTATAAELKALKDAFAKADVATLPAAIKDPRVFFVAPDNVTLTSVSGSNTYSTAASADYFDPYTARVKPLVDAINAIGNRLLAPAPAPSFEKLLLTWTGGFAPFTTQVTLDKDGNATYERSNVWGGPVGPANVFLTGKATAAELQAVKDAFAKADFTTLPKSIDDPALIMDIPSNKIVATVGGADYTTTVLKAGFYGSYKDRVKPLVDAVQAIENRLLNASQPTTQTITGVVKAIPGGIRIGNYAVAKGALDRVILLGVNKNVTVVAKVNGNVLDVQSVKGTAWTWLNVRKGASYWSPVLGTLKKGEALTITGLSGEWLKHDYKGQVGFSSRWYVTVGN